MGDLIMFQQHKLATGSKYTLRANFTIIYVAVAAILLATFTSRCGHAD